MCSAYGEAHSARHYPKSRLLLDFATEILSQLPTHCGGLLRDLDRGLRVCRAVVHDRAIVVVDLARHLSLTFDLARPPDRIANVVDEARDERGANDERVDEQSKER